MLLRSGKDLRFSSFVKFCTAPCTPPPPLGSREAVFPTKGLVFFKERHLGQRWLLEALEETEDELDFRLSLSRSLVGLRGGKGGAGETEDDPTSIGELLPSFDPVATAL